MTPCDIQVVPLPHFGDLPMPEYATQESAGMDLRAAIDADTPRLLAPGARDLIPTGLTMALPEGFEAQVRPRSGLAARHGVTVLNSPGTIDADFRGEVQVILINHGDTVFTVRRGDRIAQMVLAPVTRAHLAVAVELPASTRGSGGFGSTGTR